MSNSEVLIGQIMEAVETEELLSVCKTPRQMQLANAYCRYLELAEQIVLEK